MKNKIRLDTHTDAVRFAQIASALGGQITVTDGDNHRVNGKSVLGMLYALEFDELWVESENDIYTAIQDFVIN